MLQIDNKIVGCGGINYSDGKSIGIISWDMINPFYQGKGLGSKILKFRLNRLKNTRSVKQIMVRTSQLTFPFYKKNGFHTEKIVKNYWAAGFEMYLMRYHSEFSSQLN